jgi:class 3 adenylate cyclase
VPLSEIDLVLALVGLAPTERKLAAILSADVVGYSRLMAEDEAETAAAQTDSLVGRLCRL